MNINVASPSFISYLESITNNISSHVDVSSYFTLSQESKMSTQYTVIKLVRNLTKVRLNLSDDELKMFLTVLRKRNEESENYEFATILDDIHKNFDIINGMTLTAQKTPAKKTNKAT